MKEFLPAEGIEPKTIPGTLLQAIVEKRECSARWLLTGEGEVFGPEPTRELNEIDRTILEAFQGVEPEYQVIVARLLRGLCELQQAHVHKKPPDPEILDGEKSSLQALLSRDQAEKE